MSEDEMVRAMLRVHEIERKKKAQRSVATGVVLLAVLIVLTAWATIFHWDIWVNLHHYFG